MEVSPTFLKARACAFSLITLVSFLWITLLSVEAFTRWSLSGEPEQCFLVALLLINLITVIMLLVLLVVRFRAWLDGARLGLLLTAHIGIAATYSFWFPTLPCADNGDEKGVCGLVNMYTLIGCWVNPLLLVIYTACLILMVHLRRKRLAAEMKEVSPGNLEGLRIRGSTLPIMLPNEERRGSSNATQISRPLLSERNSTQTTVTSKLEDKSQRTRSARLSKPLPACYM